MGQSQSKEPEPGDLIEIFRGAYQHWAVYVGDGYVVHVTVPPLSEVPQAVSNNLMSATTEKAMVRKEKLQDVVEKCKWRVSNKLDEKYQPRSADIIVEEACAQVGKMLPYSLYSRNCEHFANKLRYGKAESRQVRQAGDAAAATGGIIMVVGTVAGALAAALGSRRN